MCHLSGSRPARSGALLRITGERLLRSSTRSAGSSTPQLSRTRSAGTAAAEPSTDWWVIACGTSISDSTPPSDSASVNSRVRAAISAASGWRKLTIPLNPGQRTSLTPGVGAQQLDDRRGAARVGLHPQLQRAQPAVDEEAIERPRNGADGVLDEAQPLVPARRARGDHDAADDVGVAAEVLGRGVHDEVGAELERALVDRRRERVVDRDERVRAGGRRRPRCRRRPAAGWSGSRPRSAACRRAPRARARRGRSGRRGRTSAPSGPCTLSTSR